MGLAPVHGVARQLRYHCPMPRPALGVRLRIDLGELSSLGPGKIALLERIEASGSLSQAARELRMSYRRAWLLLDDLNHAFAEPVSTASVGGSGGGGARLTDFGRRIIQGFREVEQASRDLAGSRLAWLVAAARPGGAHAVSRRPVTRSAQAPVRPTVRSGARRASPADRRGRAAKRS